MSTPECTGPFADGKTCPKCNPRVPDTTSTRRVSQQADDDKRGVTSAHGDARALSVSGSESRPVSSSETPQDDPFTEYWRIRACSPLSPWCNAPSYVNCDHYDGHPAQRDAAVRRMAEHSAATDAAHREEVEKLQGKIDANQHWKGNYVDMMDQRNDAEARVTAHRIEVDRLMRDIALRDKELRLAEIGVDSAEARVTLLEQERETLRTALAEAREFIWKESRPFSPVILVSIDAALQSSQEPT